MGLYQFCSHGVLGYLLSGVLNIFILYLSSPSLSFISKVLVHALNVPINMALEEGQRSGPLAQHLVVEVLKAKSLPQGLLGLVAQLH